MDFHVTLDGRRNLSGQIYRQVRAAILDGRLRAGEPLPPTRELAERVDVSRNTVTVAYDRLAAEGFVTSRVGAGTFVNGELHPAAPRAHMPDGRLRPRAIWADVSEITDLSGDAEFDFRTGFPDARMFPYETWRRLIGRELRASAVGGATYGDPAGHCGLREAIARHIAVSRAVRVTGADVLVTNGVQQALDLVGRVLIEPGACVAVEDPGYAPPRRLFHSLGARVVGVPVDAEGLVVDAIPNDARMVYVTPSHQFPLGMPMSLRRRMALLAWADRHGAVLVEDDYDSEFRYSGRPIEPLHTLDHHGLVLYVGSFSKVMLPTFRLGFLIAPPSLHRPLRAAKFVADWYTALPMQAALARFIEDGTLARHIRRMRTEYQTRHQRIARTLAGELSGWLQPIPSVAGLHLSAFVRHGTIEDTVQVVKRARKDGVALYAVSQFATASAARPGLILGYGSIPTARIDEGLARLRRCLEAAG